MSRFYFPSNLATVFAPTAFIVEGWSKTGTPILGEQLPTHRFGNLVELDLGSLDAQQDTVIEVLLYDWTRGTYKPPQFAVVFDKTLYMLPSSAAAKEFFNER